MKLSDLLPLLPWEGLPIPRFLFNRNKPKLSTTDNPPNCAPLWNGWAHISRFANRVILGVVRNGVVSPMVQSFWLKQGLSLEDIRQCINNERGKVSSTLPSTVTLYHVFHNPGKCRSLRNAKDRNMTIKVKGGALSFTDSKNLAETIADNFKESVIIELDVPNEDIITCYETNGLISFVGERKYLVVMPYVKVEPKEIIKV